ncbi:glutathione S-transferase family protein [Aestuariicella hydrocarbonica]|uniref:Glutathione S-transferase family protein n=1 Tax=Pseudomaricurvus hydrocarbonicus TaxID=1470433 RepID=A0A9E5MLI2_9GAMM|nr:glutathione S-transferase family protein [Aestuariicella hydrocarbonica]NHO64583.1 glutathione S-transferase family protein [Aestuariicella hydrocarbonica]
MLTLHGFPSSNYHNIVKHALLQKGIPFEEHIVYPQTPEMLAVNPMGKAPSMTTESGTHLSESTVLVDYLEDAYPDNPLYPADADARAQVRQLMKISELYIELPARRLLPSLLVNAPADEDTLKEVRAMLTRGINSLNTLAKFSPYVLGDELSAADIYLRYVLNVAKQVATTLLHWDLATDIPGLSEWSELMASTPIAQKIDADREANHKEFMAYIAAAKAKE